MAKCSHCGAPMTGKKCAKCGYTAEKAAAHMGKPMPPKKTEKKGMGGMRGKR